jgi:hypothetical protein
LAEPTFSERKERQKLSESKKRESRVGLPSRKTYENLLIGFRLGAALGITQRVNDKFAAFIGVGDPDAIAHLNFSKGRFGFITDCEGLFFVFAFDL